MIQGRIRKEEQVAGKAGVERLLQRSVALACCVLVLETGVMGMGGGRVFAATAPHEIPPLPTVHPTLTPTSAISLPLMMRGDHTSVWHLGLDQRMFLQGHVAIELGYRLLKAENAAVWLTPSKEAGENTFDVAIYLAGGVEVFEGAKKNSTVTSGNELMVTTRISQQVQLAGTPTSKAEDSNAIVMRGESIRQELLNRPAFEPYIPEIVVTSMENALRAGWIARTADNRFVAGPGDLAVERDENGKVISTAAKPAPAPPRPTIVLARSPGSVLHSEETATEIVTTITNPYLIYNAMDGKPPVTFHAQRMVLFSPLQKDKTAGDKTPSTAQRVTGAYMEGDVTIDVDKQAKGVGGLEIRADRIYYDFLSQRAIMLDATMQTVDTLRNVPVYVRASEIRQLARGEYAAKKATFSTSEFATPHYHIGASDVYLHDVTPEDDTIAALGTGAGGGANDSGLPAPAVDEKTPRVYAFTAKNATGNVQGIPIFYWPYLAGDTSDSNIPLRKIRVSNSSTYGLSIETTWDPFALTGNTAPKGVHADLELDEFGKRGPGGGVDVNWHETDSFGQFRSYGIEDTGVDRLGRNVTNQPLLESDRGRIDLRDQHDLGDGWTLNLEASYISDPNFLQEYFTNEFTADKEHETSAYLKHVQDTEAYSFLGKYSLNDFTTIADEVDDQFMTEKKPEAKYFRIGDPLFDMFTYYSESGVANLHTDITNYTPNDLGISSSNGLSGPASHVPGDIKFRQYYQQQGWTTQDVLRGDTRHEIDAPLQLGDLMVTPYVTGRVTAWDDGFTEDRSNTTRLWGQVGLRSSMQFWKVYDDIDSTFLDIHQIRHVIEPQFNLFATGTDQQRNELQPFDRDVEGISRASGFSMALNQKWQTKRGGPGHWRNVDWLTLNVQWNQFFDKDDPSGTLGNLFYPMSPLRGFYFTSRPELSLVENSVAADATWRVGEQMRVLAEENYNTTTQRLEQFASGVAVDQTSSLSYFIGNRYVRELNSDEVTLATTYNLTKKYELDFAESYDISLKKNILTSVTLLRKLPRFNVALTLTYDADNADTSVVFTAWPEGLPQSAFGNRSTGLTGQRQ